MHPNTRSRKHVARAAASLAAVYGLLMLAGCGGSSSDPAPPQTTYQGTLYMASTSGGHIAVIPVTIDPANAAAPITIGTLGRIQLSAGMGASNQTHNFHDVRLDGNKLYYSAIKTDSTGGADAGKVHLGWIDLANANAVHDAVIDADAGVDTSTGMAYCGSGQTSTHFVPMTMSHPAYIDAIEKAGLASGTVTSTRTFIEDFRTSNSDYLFAHGVNSPDGSKLFVAVNDTSAAGGGVMANMSGSVTGYLLNMSDVTAGTVSSTSVTASNTVTGLTAAGGTIAFRSTFTPDGTKILQAGRDRLVVLNASTLAVLDNNAAIGGSYVGVENHDVMPTPDGKYAILALRFKYSATGKMDSGIQLYDLTNKTAVGAPVSACNGCHNPGNPGAVATDRATCGVDGTLTVVTQ